MKKIIAVICFLVLLSSLTILNSCKKDDTTPTTTTTLKYGTVTFDYARSPHTDNSVTINNQTQTGTDNRSGVVCGEISPYCATFVLPVGTYTFTWTSGIVGYSGPNSVTVIDGSCNLVEW
jgi:hypothetical protein